MANQNKTRKIDSERRIFQEKWTEQYFFFEFHNKPVCLICLETIAVLKAYNLKRHYTTKHAPKYDQIEGQLRKDLASELKQKLSHNLALISKKADESEIAIKASYAVAEIIAKRLKPFSEGEFIKECLEVVGDIVCPEKKSIISNICLSSCTVEHRIEDITENIDNTLIRLAENFEAFSVAIAEYADVLKPPHTLVAIFIRGIDSSFDIVEEMVSLVTTERSFESTDLHEQLMNIINKFHLDFNKLSGVTSDQSQSVVKSDKGLMELLEAEMKLHSVQRPELVMCYSIIQERILCCNMVRFSKVIKIVKSTLNFICSQLSRHDCEHLQDLLSTLNEECGGVISNSEISFPAWRVLREFYNLIVEINEFMDLRNKPISELLDAEWISDLAFVVDMCKHLQVLKFALQRKDVLVTNVYDHFGAFEIKLQLWEAQLKNSITVHFPTLNERTTVVSINTEKYAEEVKILRQEFSTRLQYIKKHDVSFSIFTSPFEVSISSVPERYKMELKELKASEDLQTKFLSTPLMEFYKCYVPRINFPELVENALTILSLFGSTYQFEQISTKLKMSQLNLRNRFADEQLQNLIKIGTTNIKFDYCDIRTKL